MSREVLDLRGIPCPKNAAKASLHIATMMTGEEIEIILDNGEPMENVPSSLETEGHTIEKSWPFDEKSTAILVTVG